MGVLRNSIYLSWVLGCWIVGAGMALSTCAFAAPPDAAIDTDGDGLTDYREVHKHRTDPNRNSTAGNGAFDGDWEQRREFNYSVRAILRVMSPYNLETLEDDYQDARVLKETEEYAELEVILYPYNSNDEAFVGNGNWQEDYAGMTEFLESGVVTNWDEEMRRALIKELAKADIHVDQLTDREVVEQVSRWLFANSQSRSMFCTFYVTFVDGKPRLLAGAERAFQRDKGDPQWSVEQQFDHELYGKSMFANRTYGTCTSTAVYQTTVLRALGIPTRMILCIPPADASDPNQLELLDKGLTNHRVRSDVKLAAVGTGDSFSSHTFCEVFVGGRWRRLNYTKLCQNVLARNYLGLMIKVHTFRDLSDAQLAPTWGRRYAQDLRDDQFPHSNPYRLIAVSDQFGKYADIPNPPAEKELTHVTVSDAYWANADDAPAEIQALSWQTQPGGARFFIHCDEWLDDAGDYFQYKLFMHQADNHFVLRAKGHPDVACRLSKSSYTHRSRNLCELEMVIPRASYSEMMAGVTYRLHPHNALPGYQWTVKEDVELVRQ